MITQLQRIKAARRIVVGLLFVFMAIAPMLAFAEGSLGADGQDGKEDNPFTIKNADELAYFAELVNSGTTTVNLTDGNTAIIEPGFKDSHIKLTADINLNGQNWKPIGITGNNFKGHFNGDGHVVTGLKIEITSSTNRINAGLFGNVSNGEIRNLGVRLAMEGIKVESTTDVKVGGIVGYANNNTTIRNCYVDAEKGGKIIVKAATVCLGGIAGESVNYGTIIHCYSMVDIEAESVANLAKETNPYIGGIVGINDGTISHCYATGSMIGKGEANLFVGGICGKNSAPHIQNNLALNKELRGETNNGNCYVNRIVGETSGAITNNYANPEMTVTPANGSTANNKSGADTCLDDFKSHLTGISGSEWGTAWVWPDGKLPQLLKINDKDNYTNELLGGQVAYYASNYLQPNWFYNPVKAIKNAKGNNGLSPQTPIEINTAAELAYFAKQVNAGGKQLKLANGDDIDNSNSDKEGFSAYYFALSANIDLRAGEWTPIGNMSQPFCGHFDGKGHVVKGLKIDINDQASKIVFAGLFGSTSGGEIRNLGVRLAEEGIKVECTNEVCVGGIVGYTFNTTIRNCYVDAEKGGKIRVNTHSGALLGGIAGNLEGTITHCYSTVDIKAESVARYVIDAEQETNLSIGGIVGSNNATISHCYATGSVIGVGKVEGGLTANLSIGGICGYNSGSLIQNNLALNKELRGETNKGQCYVNRIVGQSGTALSNNYANPKMPVTPVSGNLTNNEAGTDTWLDTFKDDLRNVSGGDGWRDGKGWKWPDDPSTTLLPKLMVAVTDASGTIYENWPGIPAQPNIDAAKNYLSACPRLHIQSPTGVDLTVTDAADTNNTLIADNTPVRPGTKLKLAHAITKDGYSFNHYLWGTSANRIDQEITDDTYIMPNQDIWISASVSYTEPTPPEPVYHTVSLPAVEGATTNPGAGSYEVESWDNFRFYLTLDPAYSDSQPIVTTSRGETIQPRMSDGAYLVKYVRTDIDIFIAGIQPNTPTANGAIDAAATDIRAEGRALFITVPHAAEALLCDLSGRLLQRLSLAPGQTRVDDLRPGIYIVKLSGEDGVKVIIK